jgi:hypothetical protein
MGTVPGVNYSLPYVTDNMSAWSFLSIVSHVLIDVSSRTETFNFYPINCHFDTNKYGYQQLSWDSKASDLYFGGGGRGVAEQILDGAQIILNCDIYDFLRCMQTIFGTA